MGKSKLPFVVAPKVSSRIETLGTDVSGKIKIERKGFLTVGEKSFMASANSQDTVIQSVMKISRAVSKKYKINQQEAYEQVVLAVTEPDKCSHPVYDDFSEGIAELATDMMIAEQRKQLMAAFCMPLYRVGDDITMDDVTGLHEDLVEALAKLYLDEEKKSVERLIRDDEEEKLENADVEEVEKK